MMENVKPSAFLLALSLLAPSVFATDQKIAKTVLSGKIIADTAPFALTLKEARAWKPKGKTANADNVSRVPLAVRQTAPLTAERQSLDASAKVLYAPDGMNNFANYLQPLPNFNHFNFTHWSQIDVFNWFAGTADKTIQIPARPWVETAHKNGVKVIGSVFFGVAQWGGSPDTMDAFLEQDALGRFIFADRLIQMANYYGFDGWLINQETDLTVIKTDDNQLVKGKHNFLRGQQLAEKMLAFMQYLTNNAPDGMEIHWYDAMVANGRVQWQNELNVVNQRYLQDGATPSAHAMFLNYWWDRSMVENTVATAKNIGRSPYDVYFGADLWPTRTAQKAFVETEWLPALFNKEGTQALTSIALFGPNFHYNFSGDEQTPAYSQFQQDASDATRFYQAEQRLFVGDDLNLATNDEKGWAGLGRYLPAKTTVISLPFSTDFNVGQGAHQFNKGKKVGAAWTDMSQQDLLPTWQFAVLGNSSTNVTFDFEQAFSGGSSLSISANLSQGDVLLPLYQTQVTLSPNQQLTVTYTSDDAKAVGEVAYVYLENDQGKRYRFPLLMDEKTSTTQQTPDWVARTFALSELDEEHIVKIGLGLDTQNSHKTSTLTMNLGGLRLN